LLVLTLWLSADEWKTARPDYEWSFPRDHWAHGEYRTEWWYFTGELGERFAYQFTFFRIGVLPARSDLASSWATSGLLMGHLALTDLEKKEHRFSEVLYRDVPLLAGFGSFPEPRIAWSRAPAGTDDLWSLDWNGEAFDFSARDDATGISIRLTTRPRKPLVLQGPDGFSRKGESANAASQYYSFTRLETRGEIELDGERFEVSGESWMDKEFSSSHLEDHQAGWDWFSLRLGDGRELMLYLMRDEAGGIDFGSGTLVGADGTARYLAESDFEVEVLDRWTSPATGASYPSKWRIRLAGLDLIVTPALADQENRSGLPRGVFYWEGAVAIDSSEGARLGRGFVELTGYGKGNRPPV
jgi:predicted secreted hydrolase